MIHPFARLFIIGTVMVQAAFLTGCEGAQVPLGDADEVAVDARLIGEWTALDDEQEASVMTIWAFNDTEYYLEWNSEDPDEDKMQVRAFMTKIGDNLFSSVQCVVCNDDEREWYYYRLAMESEDALSLQAIKNKHYRNAMGEMMRSRDVRRYVKRHLNDPDFFEEEIALFIRAETED